MAIQELAEKRRFVDFVKFFKDENSGRLQRVQVREVVDAEDVITVGIGLSALAFGEAFIAVQVKNGILSNNPYGPLSWNDAKDLAQVHATFWQIMLKGTLGFLIYAGGLIFGEKEEDGEKPASPTP